MLKDIPMNPGIIYETIVTTTDLKNNPNAAPMGIMLNNLNEIILQPYCTSDTYTNIRNTGFCGINFTNNPTLFTLATLFQEELTSKYFTKIGDYNVPIITSCLESFMIIKIRNEKEVFTEKAFFKGDILIASFQPVPIQPVTRAFSLLLEILIYASRIIAFTNKFEFENKISPLKEKIEEYSEIIQRITNDTSEHHLLLKKVLTKIEQIR